MTPGVPVALDSATMRPLLWSTSMACLPPLQFVVADESTMIAPGKLPVPFTRILPWPLAVSAWQSVSSSTIRASASPLLVRVSARAMLREVVWPAWMPTIAANAYGRVSLICTAIRSHGVPSTMAFAG